MRPRKSDFAAFPRPDIEEGLTGREYAAVHLTAGLISKFGVWPGNRSAQDEIAQIGVALADALMLELNK